MLQTYTRESTDPAHFDAIQHMKLYTTPAADPAYVMTYPSVPAYQKLYEVLISDNKGAPGRWKKCQHYKRWANPPLGLLKYPYGHKNRGNTSQPYLGFFGCPTILYKWTSLNPSTGFGPLDAPFTDLPELLISDADGNIVDPPADLAALKQRSLNAMLPLIKSELSLINSVIELKDFSSLPETIANLLRFKNYMGTTKDRALKVLFSSNKSVARTAADVYLQCKFNILPLLSDIRGVKTALSRFERRINGFISREGRVQVKHFTFALDEPSLVNIPWTPKSGYTVDWGQFASWALNANVKCLRQVTYDQTIFHAEVMYNYNYTGYQREHARVLALLDAFGINLNPAIAWNAIPWSFVIDWVVNVSSLLNSIKVSNMEPKINIHKYLWSVKRKRYTDLAIQQYSQAWNTRVPSLGWVPLPRVTESAYRRHVELPSSSSLTTSGLSSTEFSLGAALAIARRRHPRKRS